MEVELLKEIENIKPAIIFTLPIIFKLIIICACGFISGYVTGIVTWKLRTWKLKEAIRRIFRDRQRRRK